MVRARKNRWLVVLIAVAVIIALLAAGVVALNVRDEDPIPPSDTFSATPAHVARGEYLARAGNCITCHTARGGAAYAGGRSIATPFGTVYSSNITPDAKTGIGRWTSAHFWRAMHNGRSKDGRLLYPAFPYTEYTLVTREDADAIFAYLRSLTPVEQAARPHELRFLYRSQAALAVWRALFFEPKSFEADTRKPAEWNRGAYLVRGLGHCNTCHSSRNVLGGTTDLELGGGLIPAMGWYAPSLLSPKEASVKDWSNADVVALLKHGVSRHASTLGPMAEVVYRSTQFLSDEDLAAMAVFLRDLPQSGSGDEHAGPLSWLRRAPERPSLPEEVRRRGAAIYDKRCADCHGDKGQGADGQYPRLAGNRAVTLEVPANVIRAVLSGGYPPSTAGNPRPYGMPPFAHVLNDEDIAAVISYVRSSWSNAAAPVSPFDVQQYRAGRGQ